MTTAHFNVPRWVDLNPAAVACPKVSHATRGLAEAARRSLERRGLDRPEHGRLHTYYCRKCRGWHTGHTQEEA